MLGPGLEQLSRHFPDLRTSTGQTGLVLRAIGFFTLTTLFFVFSDRLVPDWQPDGQIIVMAIGFLLLARFFTQKRSFQARYGASAYRYAFVRTAIPGLAVIFATVAHCAYMPGLPIPEVWWKNLLRLLGMYLVLVGAWLWLRAILTFGVDNLAMLYVYYPDQSRLVAESIYGLLRHPIYASALWVITGLCLLNGTWQALVFALLAPLGLFGWVRLVEERELLERFPDYDAYRRRVPAFWTLRILQFWRYLLSGR